MYRLIVILKMKTNNVKKENGVYTLNEMIGFRCRKVDGFNEPMAVFETKEEILTEFRLETYKNYLDEINDKAYDVMRDWLQGHSDFGDDANKLSNDELIEIWKESARQMLLLPTEKIQKIWERTQKKSLDDMLYKQHQGILIPLSVITGLVPIYYLYHETIKNNIK